MITEQLDQVIWSTTKEVRHLLGFNGVTLEDNSMVYLFYYPTEEIKKQGLMAASEISEAHDEWKAAGNRLMKLVSDKDAALREERHQVLINLKD